MVRTGPCGAAGMLEAEAVAQVQQPLEPHEHSKWIFPTSTSPTGSITADVSLSKRYYTSGGFRKMARRAAISVQEMSGLTLDLKRFKDRKTLALTTLPTDFTATVAFFRILRPKLRVLKDVPGWKLSPTKER